MSNRKTNAEMQALRDLQVLILQQETKQYAKEQKFVRAFNAWRKQVDFVKRLHAKYRRLSTGADAQADAKPSANGKRK